MVIQQTKVYLQVLQVLEEELLEEHLMVEVQRRQPHLQEEVQVEVQVVLQVTQVMEVRVLF